MSSPAEGDEHRKSKCRCLPAEGKERRQIELEGKERQDH